jgi:hypothetical protein
MTRSIVRTVTRTFAALAMALSFTLGAASPPAPAAPAFPGAQGWAAHTPGGRGG